MTVLIPKRVIVSASIVFVAGTIFGLATAAWFDANTTGSFVTGDYIKFIVCLTMVLLYLVVTLATERQAVA